MSQLSKLNRRIGRLLGPQPTLWLRRLRHGDLAWQQRLSRRTGLHLFGSTAQQRSAGHTIHRAYDALRLTREMLAVVRERLSESAIEYVELPDWNPYDPLLVIHENDLQRALSALAALEDDEGWIIETVPLRARRRIGRRQETGAIRVERRFVAPNGRELSTGFGCVMIEPWREVGSQDSRVDGGTFADGTLLRKVQKRNTFVEYLTPEIWNTAVAADHRLRWPHPHLYEVQEPIDVVYTWVNGEDPVWLRKKEAYVAEVPVGEVNETAVSESRFANRDELLYSLRSLEAYASWVNHVYIVTDGQVPEWLDTSHPKVSIVDHRDIFSDTDALPVFNSHAIESQLHHIPGLSERYLYMNDDVMLMRPVMPELFFTSNGMSKFFPSKAPLDVGEASSADMPVLSAAKRGRDYIASEHGRTVTNKFKHAPHPQLRSVLEEFERSHQELFDTVSRSRFRHPDDYSIASSLYHYEAYARGKAIPASIRYAYVDIASSNAEARLDWWMRSRALDVICINDTGSSDTAASADPQSHTAATSFVAELLEMKFPVPSSFERREDQPNVG